MKVSTFAKNKGPVMVKLSSARSVGTMVFCILKLFWRENCLAPRARFLHSSLLILFSSCCRVGKSTMAPLQGSSPAIQVRITRNSTCITLELPDGSNGGKCLRCTGCKKHSEKIALKPGLKRRTQKEQCEQPWSERWQFHREGCK